MITGNGKLVLRNGRHLAVSYEFAANRGDHRAGQVLCDTTELDPDLLNSRLQLICNNGAVIVLAVMHHGDSHLGVIGRLQPQR